MIKAMMRTISGGDRGLCKAKTWVACASMCLVLSLIGCGGKSGSGDLAIESSSPQGDVYGYFEVKIKFSDVMVSEDKLNKELINPLLSFEPTIAGKERWVDEKTLIFRPEGDVEMSTQYKVKILKGLRSINDKRLSKNHIFEFNTERIKGEFSVLGDEKRALAMQQIKLKFNQDVKLEDIKKHCGFKSAQGNLGLNFENETIEAQGKLFVVQPDGELSLDTTWSFNCGGDLRGVVGNIGVAAENEKEFQTYGPLTFIDHYPKGNDVVPTEGQRLSIDFSNPLAPPYEMELSPKVRGFPKRCYNKGDAPPGISCGVTLEPQTRYTLTVKKEQKDTFGQALGEEKVIHFRTSDSEPTLSFESGFWIAELSRPFLPIWSRNVKKVNVRVIALDQKTLAQNLGKLDWWEQSVSEFKVPKSKETISDVEVGGEDNKWKQVALDPASVFGKASGPGMYYVEVGSEEVESYPFDEGGVQKTLVNFTNIGVVSKRSPSRGLIWATELSTGKSLSGALVVVRNDKGKVLHNAKTNKEGIAFLPRAFVDKDKPEEKIRIFVSKGKDWTMIDPSRSGGISAWNFDVNYDFSGSSMSLRGHLHTDRGIYRPGEKVHIKGLARVTRLGESLKVPKNKNVDVTINGPRGNEIHSAKATLSKFGGFWLDFDVPADARLGDYTMSAKLKHGVFTQRFAVEEFKASTFEVKGKSEQTRIVKTGKFEAKIDANYFYGSPLREGEVDMTVHSRPRTIGFSKHEDFRFEKQKNYDSYYYGQSDYSQTLITEDSLNLNNEGQANLAFNLSAKDVDSDADLLVRAKVTAPSNEVIVKTFTVPYFKYKRYFGIKSPGYFLEVKERQEFEVIGVNPEGDIVKSEATIKVERLDWNCVWEDWGYRGSYHCKENTKVVLDQKISLQDGKPSSFAFVPDSGGEYKVTVDGGKNQAVASQRYYAWGDGGGSWRSSDGMTFDLIADKKKYKVGDTATLILKTDLAEATGLVTIERDGIIETNLVEITQDKKHLEIPITDKMAPNVYVSVSLVQGRMGEGVRGKPRMRMGMVNLTVAPEDTTLQVEVSTEQKDVRPGDVVEANVLVTDQQGNPVKAEVALTAADEGVLSLIGFKTPNPVPTFYSPWGLGVQSATQFEFIRDIPGPNTERPATGGDSGGPGSARSRFMSTAIWKPGIVTDSKGRASVKFEAPDNLTAFRLMAVAADKGDRFGSSEQRFTVSKPLQLHRLLPRFLTKGDLLQGGVVLHNETGSAGTATVTMEVQGGVSSTSESIQTIEVPKDGKVPVLFSIEAKKIEEGNFTFSAVMNGESDKVIFSLPVKHPSPEQKRHVAHGVVEGAKTIELELPPEAIAESAMLHVSVDPNGLAGLGNGLRDLVGYPYGCLEQTTSKVIPMIALRGLAEGLDLAWLEGAKLDGFVKAGIAKIGRHQLANGGFSLWPGGSASAYYTAYALWGLHVAQKAGYSVDESRIKEGLTYLKYQARRPDTSGDYYNEKGDLGNQAFALYIRGVLGSGDAQAATKLYERFTELPVYGQAFLAKALAKELGNEDPVVKEISERLSGLALEANKNNTLIQEGPDLYYYMSSSLRSSAVVLDALVALDKNNVAITPLVRTIMNTRRKRPYLNTQEQIYSLLALSAYADSAKGKPPTVGVRLGDEVLIEGALKGKNNMRLASVALSSRKSIEFKSKGKAHYNVELSYHEKTDALKDKHNGLTLTREYFDEEDKPVKTFKVGDVVKVKLTMPIDTSVSHLMVSDRLPAGFEALNSRLKTTGSGDSTFEREPYGSFKEVRDERVDFSSEYNWRSTYVREYLMRAIAEGTFTLPPSRAELMYEPEKHSQTALKTIEITSR